MKGKAIKYSEREISWLSKNRTLPISEYHQKFLSEFAREDVTACNLHSLRKRNGWKTGRTGRYEKGNIPHPDARPKGPNKTSFKKGNKPHNWKPSGSQRISKDGYIEVKTGEPGKWEQLHVLSWLSKRGKIPNGYCVAFKNGDKSDVSIENLELISRNENLQINKLNSLQFPIEIRPTVRVIGKIAAKGHELTRR